MSKAPGGVKVLVAAAFQPLNLVVLAATFGGGVLAALLLHWLLGGLITLGGLALYGRNVAALAADPAFVQRALAAGDMSRSALSADQKLAVMAEFGKLPPAWQKRVRLLQDLTKDVEERIRAGQESYLAAAVEHLAPECREALGESVELARRGAALERDGKDTGQIQERLDAVVKLLEELRGDLIEIEGGKQDLLGDTVGNRLEDLSGRVEGIQTSLKELEG